MGIFRKGTLETTKPNEPQPTPVSENQTEPKWLSIAKAEIGTQEIPGPRANPRIVEYDSVTTLKATSDEVPWCAAFVSWCLEKSGVRSARSAAARAYLEWGLPILRPRPGCIVVFSRTGGHHVAFYIGPTANRSDCIDVCGGNQSNRVCIQSMPRSRVLGYRWPNHPHP